MYDKIYIIKCMIHKITQYYFVEDCVKCTFEWRLLAVTVQDADIDWLAFYQRGSFIEFWRSSCRTEQSIWKSLVYILAMGNWIIGNSNHKLEVPLDIDVSKRKGVYNVYQLLIMVFLKIHYIMKCCTFLRLIIFQSLYEDT